MRFTSVVAAALVAAVVFAGDASAQMHPPLPTAPATTTPATTTPATVPTPATPSTIPTTATVSYKTAANGGGSGPIVNVSLGRMSSAAFLAGAPNSWYLVIQAAPNGALTMPQCNFRSHDLALLFSLHQKILENLGRAINLDCLGGTFVPPWNTMVDLDSSPFKIDVH